jgi:hypothetical protein
MSNEAIFLIAVGITTATSVAVVVYLRRPLRRLLREVCGTDDRALFWSAFSHVVLVLVPLVALTLGRLGLGREESWLFAVVGLLQWALIGLVAAMFLVALGVASFLFRPPDPPPVPGPVFDDLQRLVDKVERMRAKEILRRAAGEDEAPVPADGEAGTPPADAPAPAGGPETGIRRLGP